MDHDPARDSHPGEPAPWEKGDDADAPWREDDGDDRDDAEPETASVPSRPGIATASLLALLAVVYAVGVLVASLRGAASFIDAEAAVGALALSADAVVRGGEVWRLLTAPLVHGRLLELLVVVSLLFTFGPMLERKVGAARMLALLGGLSLAVSAAHLLLATGVVAATDVAHGLLGPALALPVLALLAVSDEQGPRRTLLVFDLIPLRTAVLFATGLGVGATVFLGVVGAARYEAHLVAVPLAPVALFVAAAWDRARARRSLEAEAGRVEEVALALLRVERLLRKISDVGMGAITTEEYRFLLRASALYRRRVSDRAARAR